MRKNLVRFQSLAFICAFISPVLFWAQVVSAQVNYTEQNLTTESPTKTVIILTSDMAVRTLSKDVLVKVGTLPAGTQVDVAPDAQTVNNAYQNEQGDAVFSSTGFIGRISIVKSTLSSSEVARLNAVSTGLYLSAVILDQLQTGLEFPALRVGTPDVGFTTNYNSNGKPKKAFTTSVLKRFPLTLNKVISNQSSSQKKKWTAIMTELQKVADRTHAIDKSFFIIDPEVANQKSIDFENSGKVSTKGAWSIAVLGTAARHGFQNVPCAEFMGEILREAYKRAGYNYSDDFNSKNGNVLSYTGGAALVTNFSDYLNKAGWIPWDPQTYIPPTGAFMMNESGKSPGHTYMSAGDSGRFIFDNGSPQGRDLRVTTQKTIELMYMNGVFFLPPGLTPKKW